MRGRLKLVVPPSLESTHTLLPTHMSKYKLRSKHIQTHGPV